MEIDSSEKYLATGDTNGLVKVWIINEYCTKLIGNENLITNARKSFIYSFEILLMRRKSFAFN